MLDWLFGPKARDLAQAPLRDERVAAAPIPLRAAVIIHNPVLEAMGRQKLSRAMGWYDPDELARQYIDDLRSCSGGIAQYSIVERHEVDGYPAKIDGFSYDDASFLGAWQRRSGFHQPDAVDYPRLLREFGIIEKIERNQIDEVWLFGFPYAGYYESMMVGQGACWCNAPPLTTMPGANRRFVVMGFNFERDVGCMLENFGHRVESIMTHVYRNHPREQNMWSRFTRYDRTTPGMAECGNVHFAPSSQNDYDWGNQREVLSRADSWYRYPDLSAPPRPMRCAEWGDGNMRGHHMWWLDHLPRVAGATAGVSNNWWEYALRVDTRLPG